ncbi:MAG: hypothetical protein V4474_02105 [Patescibacteria group bacterium]
MLRRRLRLAIMGAVLLNIFLLPVNVAPMPALAVADLPADIQKHPAECRMLLRDIDPLQLL